MSEWTWDKILEHLKYEEAEVLKILNKQKYKTKTSVGLEREDISILHNIDRDARRIIYRHLKNKKHILKESLAMIELSDENIYHNKNYRNGSLEVLLYSIMEAIKLVKREMTNKPIFKIYRFNVSTYTLTNTRAGFGSVSFSPQRLYPSKRAAFKIVEDRAKVNYGSQNVEITFITDGDEKWATKLIRESNFKQLYPKVRGFNGNILSLWDNIFDDIMGILNQGINANEDPSFTIEIKGQNGKNPRNILIKRFTKSSE